MLECALDVCTCVLFPDLSSDAKESSPVDISEVFPNVVSTIGYSICRPVHGTFLSVAHKRGFESISILLTLFLDNQRWLFSSSAPFSIPTFHSSLPAPSPSAIPSLLASTLLTTYSTHFSSFHDATHHLEQISLFVDYGANPLIPRPVDEDITKPMIAEELYDIQTVVLGSQEMHTASLPIRMAGRDSDIPFNERAEEAIHQTEAQVELMACVLLQSWIRQKNAAFVHTHFRDDSITLLPKRSQCCIIRKSTALPDIDFAAYFTESDWLVSPSQVEGWEREEILSLVQTLQLQLLNVEKVIHGPLAASDCNGHSIPAEQIRILLYYIGHSVEKTMILFVAKVLPSCIKSFLLETTPIIIAKHSPRQHTSLGFLSENTAKRPYLIANQMR